MLGAVRLEFERDVGLDHAAEGVRIGDLSEDGVRARWHGEDLAGETACERERVVKHAKQRFGAFG